MNNRLKINWVMKLGKKIHFNYNKLNYILELYMKIYF